MSLRQNCWRCISWIAASLVTSQNVTAPKLKMMSQCLPVRFSYQSECHCAKTAAVSFLGMVLFSYQSECHCAKTVKVNSYDVTGFSYQSECHCAKTIITNIDITTTFSYQSECHCAKTVVAKSPLQGDVHSDLIRDNIRTIKQVNHLFILFTIILN